MENLDATDWRILGMMQSDAKYTNKEIATALGLTITPVYERIRRLEREGIIRKYVALLAPERLGMQLVAYCNVSIKEHSKPFIRQFEKEVISLKEVVECYHIAGGFDYLLKIVVSDMEAYQHFIVETLAALDNIGKVQSSFVMEVIKHSTELPL